MTLSNVAEIAIEHMNSSTMMISANKNMLAKLSILVLFASIHRFGWDRDLMWYELRNISVILDKVNASI